MSDHTDASTPPPSGGQATAPGPYHAVIRGPNGLDVSISGPAEVVAVQLRAVAEFLAPAQVKAHHRDWTR